MSVFSTYLEPLLSEDYSLIKGTQHAQRPCGSRFSGLSAMYLMATLRAQGGMLIA